ncbi:MAG TPA: peptidylprolyl isomerase [candidate division Zixibacteria bacterium]|nr:peptidylprolyl isomerase [candidate division Zixibacteria bacterium]
MTTRTYRLTVCTALLALGLTNAACAGKDQREPRADTPAKMDSAMALEDSIAKDAPAMTENAETTATKYEAPVRNADNHIVKLATNKGDLILELYRDVAPNHADSFLARVKEGFYDGIIFHRVIAGFMIQGGDPTGTGMGDPNKPGYTLNAEFSDLPHKRGTLSMARRGSGGASDPQGHNTASAQFFICHADASFLDKQYTVFGHLLAGYNTLDAIATTKTTKPGDKPVEDVVITKATVVK